MKGLAVANDRNAGALSKTYPDQSLIIILILRACVSAWETFGNVHFGPVLKSKQTCR
jgi:hypothetical protein